MHSREIGTHRRQKSRFFKDDAMFGIGECVLCYSGLLRLSQTTVAAMFIDAGTDTAFSSSDVQLVQLAARNSVSPQDESGSLAPCYVDDTFVM